MSKWKLIRQSFGTDEFSFKEGDEVLIGRAYNNTIALSSIVVSRNHCVLNVYKNKVLITDLKSANGVYVGPNKIPRDTPYTLKDSDVIGIGWTVEAPLVNIKDDEKFVFKLVKLESDAPSAKSRLQFQSENEFDDIEEQITAFDAGQSSIKKSPSPIITSKLSLKRKSDINLHEIKKEVKEEKKCRIVTIDEDVVNLLSDSDADIHSKHDDQPKVKLEPISEEPLKDQIKTENGYLEYEAFNVKQEYLGYDDEPIQIDSESDSESEHWYLRLSQNSPGKPFMKLPKDRDVPEESSYSQMDDDFISDHSFTNQGSAAHTLDGVTPLTPPSEKSLEAEHEETDPEDIIDDLITLPTRENPPPSNEHAADVVDGSKVIEMPNQTIETNKELVPIIETVKEIKKTLITQPHVALPKSKSKHTKSKPSSRSSKHKKSSKKHISNSQKEERKKRLKEIAAKSKETECDIDSSKNSSHTTSNKTTVAKVTSSNRGAFLVDDVNIVKPVERKTDPKEFKSKPNSIDNSFKQTVTNNEQLTPDDIENEKKQSSKRREHRKSSKHEKHTKSKSSHKNLPKQEIRQERVPFKSLKPLTESDETFSKKPFSKVEPFTKVEPISNVEPKPPVKPKKRVRFSDAAPEIRLFEIEPGNNMKKTSLVKTTLVDIRQMPIFSLEKITLMKILRWNPHWLEEQINNNDPPPILGHNNPPMSIFHSFTNHNQYVQLVGDLILMEIWECLTLAYMKIRSQTFGITMRIASLPPIPTQERAYELFSISVNISLPSNEAKNCPRVGEVLLVNFGPEEAKNQRFFFVHNVKCLPSPPNNIHTFYCISLYATYTEKMKFLRLGEIMVGKSLAYINKELNLFEAMEYLASSPLSEIILRPDPKHFQNKSNPANFAKSQWTKTLNPSQQAAVAASVTAALGDKPSIQMVQGPPGTGKSSVICSIVMTYFYDEHGKRQQNRGKILICATSNAAVDELVIRLLNIRQGLPKTERFRMVRVGRAEAMAARARDVSAQQLAQRDAARLLAAEPPPRNHHAVMEEISHLEAKVNMWKTQAQDAKDPVRVAYCQGRVTELLRRIALVRAGGGCPEDQLRPEQLIAAERRIIEGADIVVTTLASAQNHKMKGLKRRIALCIVDEAGQAIEPETLVPLTLDVTNLTLIGDPQQLPGYICSQRARKHGLGESLFSRLASVAEASVLLSVQYRMQADIADYPNRAFYGGRVGCAPPPRPRLPLPPYRLLAIASGDRGQGASGANEMEACGVSRLAAALGAHARARSLSLAVITPYNAHKELVKRYLRMLQPPSEPAVEVNTVDSFQGQERDIVLVSLARSHGVGFLTDAGRMNVMLTRARHALLVCLNPHAMMKNNQWRTLVEDAQRRNMYNVLPNKLCQSIVSGEVVHEDIFRYIN